MNILKKNIRNKILLTLSTFIALPILRKKLLLFGEGYYVIVHFTPRRVIDGSHYGEQNLNWNVYY